MLKKCYNSICTVKFYKHERMSNMEKSNEFRNFKNELLDKNKLLEQFHTKVDKFIKYPTSCGRRQYLSSAVTFNQYYERISEVYNSDSTFDINELEEMNRIADQILKNMGIQ